MIIWINYLIMYVIKNTDNVWPLEQIIYYLIYFISFKCILATTLSFPFLRVTYLNIYLFPYLPPIYTCIVFVMFADLFLCCNQSSVKQCHLNWFTSIRLVQQFYEISNSKYNNSYVNITVGCEIIDHTCISALHGFIHWLTSIIK